MPSRILLLHLVLDVGRSEAEEFGQGRGCVLVGRALRCNGKRERLAGLFLLFGYNVAVTGCLLRLEHDIGHD